MEGFGKNAGRTVYVLAVWLLAMIAVAPGCSSSDGDDNQNHGSNNNNSLYCGDGRALHEREQCDGDDLRDETCESQGYEGGQLACTPDCHLDRSGCYGDPCGNGVIDANEGCEGDNLGGWTCETVLSSGYDDGDPYFVGGSLGCTDLCSLDISQCIANSRCGDGVRENPEACDNGAANSDTEPDACRTYCFFPYCGDGVADTGESCDGSDLAGQGCSDHGYTGGTLSCQADCRFDLSGCL